MAYTYDQTRDNEQLRLLERAIQRFIHRYQHPVATTSTCPRQTVFLFPGGMASQLTRARTKFADGVATKQQFEFDTVWVAVDTPFGGARNLEMHRDSVGTFRDKGDRIIVADASLTLLGYDPYGGFITWCAHHNIDLFVFPWDWRRRLDETARFFVGQFLPYFRDYVVNQGGCPDPLTRFALVGHSSGGMVANLIVRGNDAILATMTAAITVATPFYGYPGQLHRWFEGEPLVNGLFQEFKQDIMETIASLPGLYTLHFLDEVTYANAPIQSGLLGDPNFQLPGYPSMDATIPAVRADAYNPQTNGTLVRYPTLTGFDRNELQYAKVQFQLLASAMDPALLHRFYNIRGVRTEADDHTPISDTAGNVTWDWIATSFDEDDPTPIVDGQPVPGDDTQPAWTARLVTNDPARCITVKGNSVSHIDMMNHGDVHDAIETILCTPGAAVSSPGTPPPDPASDDDLVDFLHWLFENRHRIRDWRDLEDPKLRKLIPLKFRSKLPGLGRRFMMNVFKRPSPKRRPGSEGGAPARAPSDPTGTTPAAPGRRTAVRRPATARGRPKSSKKKNR
jgi:hypothetical protein